MIVRAPAASAGCRWSHWARNDRGVARIEHEVVDIFAAKGNFYIRIDRDDIIGVLNSTGPIGIELENGRMKSTIANFPGVIG